MWREIQLLFRLLRVPNLIVVAVTQYLVFYHVIEPALVAGGVQPSLYLSKFLELCVVTVIITASGYVINDLQDEEIDNINRPGTNPVSELGRDFVLWLYGAMVLIGFLVSNILAFRLGDRHLLWVYPVSVGILAVYSVYLKRQPMAGNIIVALFCAGVIGLVIGAERDRLARLALDNPALAADTLNTCYLFMLIAVLATLLRELVKDLQDIEGDTAGGRRTIPVMWGKQTARWVALALGMALTASLLAPVLTGWTIFSGTLLLSWLGLLVAALAYIMVRIGRARKSRDFGLISSQLKLFLFGGLVLFILL